MSRLWLDISAGASAAALSPCLGKAVRKEAASDRGIAVDWEPICLQSASVQEG